MSRTVGGWKEGEKGEGKVILFLNTNICLKKPWSVLRNLGTLGCLPALLAKL